MILGKKNGFYKKIKDIFIWLVVSGVVTVFILGNFTTSDSTTYDRGGNISNELKLYGDQQM